MNDERARPHICEPKVHSGAAPRSTVDALKLVEKLAKFKRGIALVLAVLCFSLALPSLSNCEINSGLSSDYLQREFDWALFIDVRDIQHYLNYNGTKLHPLSRVRINLRIFRTGNSVDASVPPSVIYEELWYHKTTPIGLRRRFPPRIPTGSVGAVVLGTLDRGREHAAIATNAAIRAITDFQLKDVPTGVLLVPCHQCDAVADKLGQYGFCQKQTPTAGTQMSITLRSYPPGRDEQLFLQ